MILSPNQLSEIFSIIEVNHVIYGAQVVGTEVLSSEDKQLLKRFGINIDDLKSNFPQLSQSFHWGRLSMALKNQASNVDYKDFLSYLKKGQYVPLSPKEKYTLEYLQNKTFSHIKGLGDKIRQTANGIIIEEDKALRSKYEDVIQNELQEGVEKRKSVRQIASDIAHKTGDWGRDLNRIVDTEMNNAMQENLAALVVFPEP